MSLHPHALQNNMLASLESRAGAKISHSIKQASAQTGVDFAYLMQQADAESGFRADVKASTSSATGLFQFIDKTWLSMIEQYGSRYGIDPTQSKSDLLALRNDPKISSYMAGALAKENKQTLQNFLGQDTKIGSTELYFAHFMGPSRAAGFLKSHAQSPFLKGADLFPKEAQANKNIFFDKNHRARTLSEIYDKFDQKFSIEAPRVPTQEIPPHVTPVEIAREDTPPSVPLPKNASSPMIHKERDLSAFLSHHVKMNYGLGHLLSNPAELLWLTALDNNVDNNVDNNMEDTSRL